MTYVTGELVGTPRSKVATFGEDSQVIVSVTWNRTVQGKSAEHTAVGLDALCTFITGRLMVNLGQCIPQKPYDLLIT